MSKKLSVAPATSANSIVTGADADLTNMFLQQLSIAAYMVKHIDDSQISCPPPGPPSEVGTVTDASLDVWLEEVGFSCSLDGSSFSSMTPAMATGLCDAITPMTLSAADFHMADVCMKSLRIYPTKWMGAACSLRCSFETHSMEGRKGISGKYETFDSTKCMSALVLLHESAELLATLAEHMVKIHEMAAVQRQEEAMKRMESIVDKKIAQEQALLDEKLALNSEKSSLEEQLKATMSQLRDLEKDLVREKTYRVQLETLCNSLDSEKRDLQICLQEQSETMSTAQTELLKCQADAERYSKLVESLKKKNNDDEKAIEELHVELKKAKEYEELWLVERDDLMNQVDVLTEERDDARRNEEELFETLGERTNDLERLQESYVNMTDRCNDYQDEICDLQEDISNLKLFVHQNSTFRLGILILCDMLTYL